jgi:hypothetical protein
MYNKQVEGILKHMCCRPPAVPGIISNITAETLGFGPVAPFVVALAPLALCGILVTRTWEENYGNRNKHRLIQLYLFLLVNFCLHVLKRKNARKDKIMFFSAGFFCFYCMYVSR